MELMLVVLVALCFLNVAHSELLMVVTLTRHGERAPDKIVAKETCTKIWKSKKAIVKDFHAYPGRLTPLGVQRMRDVGYFLRERYIEKFHWDGKWMSEEGFVSSSYQLHPQDWDFRAREGYRQQRSMAAISLGIFPNEPVPITVAPRRSDSTLGGPAPSCGEFTAKMIVDWHATKGKELVEKHWDVVAPFEEICNVSLKGNPVNAEPGGPNPHAWIGDVSDTLDSAFATHVKLPDSITPELHDRLTRLAFELQEGSHYDDPKGATMFVGSFADELLGAFEEFNNLKPGKSRPKKAPKMRLYSCSRELMYGLQHLFGWETNLKGQPKGRVLSGTTFVWELHKEPDLFDPSKEGLLVRGYYWTPELQRLVPLEDDVALSSLRKRYEDYVAKTGRFEDICDLKHFNELHNHHNPKYINPSYFKHDDDDMTKDDYADEDEDEEEDDDAAATKKDDHKEEAGAAETTVSQQQTSTLATAEVMSGTPNTKKAVKDQGGFSSSTMIFFFFVCATLVVLAVPKFPQMYRRFTGYQPIV